jgi:hypothetical protein
MCKTDQRMSWFLFISIMSIMVVLIISCNDSSNSPTNPTDTEATFFVATTGNDDNTCTTATTPCKTITRALSRARLKGGSNVIHVAEGIYDVLNGEQFPLNPPTDTVIKGIGKVAVEAALNSGQVFWIGSPRVTLENLRMSAWYDAVLVDRVAADVTITDSQIMSVTGNGTTIRDGNATVTSTTILAYDSGLDVQGTTEAETNATMTKTTVISTHDHAVNVGPDCIVTISDSAIIAQPEDPDNSSITALFLQNNADVNLTNTHLTKIGDECVLKCYTTTGTITNGGGNLLTPPYNTACKCNVTPPF